MKNRPTRTEAPVAWTRFSTARRLVRSDRLGYALAHCDAKYLATASEREVEQRISCRCQRQE